MTMATIFIDDRRYHVDEQQNLLAASLSLGVILTGCAVLAAGVVLRLIFRGGRGAEVRG